MQRNLFKTLGVLLWLAPAVIAYRFWLVWDRLPSRMASHFDAAGHANGWMPRENTFYFTVGFVALLAAVFSIALFVIVRRYALAKLYWVLLAFFHLELWAVVYSLNSTLDYNLDGSPLVTLPLLTVTAFGTLVVLIVAFYEKRGTALPSTDVVAEEVHSAKGWSALFLLPLVAIVASAVAVPNLIARLTVGIVAVLVLAAVAMAWDGFHYSFTRHGVEIRTLGFRLKSIPLRQIKNYEIKNWNVARGYGIRGVGNHKAYVWGKTGVRVEMYDGEIFLGHGDPQRIIHDLNVIKRYQLS